MTRWCSDVLCCFLLLQGLFLYQNGSGVWYLGPVVGGEVVYLRVADGASSPDKVKKVWQAWSETQQTWVNDAARFQCSGKLKSYTGNIKEDLAKHYNKD